MKRTIPIRRAFELIGVGPTKGNELIASGELPAFRIGTRVFTTEEDTLSFIASRPVYQPRKSKAAA